MQDWGEPAFRARQIWTGIHKNLKQIPEEITTLPGALKERLDENFQFKTLKLLKELHSRDGSTTKALFELHDGKAIETVLMLYHTRRTVCVSTQVGCALDCAFCATGQMGFQRHLSRGEIAAQVYACERQLASSGEHVTNVVLMGMGEPFHNYDESIAALELLNDPEGMNMGARRMTVSTVGLIDQIRRYTREKQPYKLAISLHAATDDLRSQIIPINRANPLRDLLPACAEYVEQSGRRITFEWAMIENVNDTEEQLEELIELLQRLLCHVNLIPLNPSAESSYRRTPMDRVAYFQKSLEENNISCSVRVRRGLDIHAGCGQLAVHNQGS